MTEAKQTHGLDEMGNATETFEVWYVECACVVANMYPSLSAYFTEGQAENAAEDRRKDASTWACVRVTGPHLHVRPVQETIKHGRRVACAADFGIAI